MNFHLPLYVAWCFHNTYQILENPPLPPPSRSWGEGFNSKVIPCSKLSYGPHLPLYVALCFSKMYQIYENPPPTHHR